MHADLVGQGGTRLDRVGMDVLEQLEPTVTIRRLEHGDVGVVAIGPDGGVAPLSRDRVTTKDFQAKVGEESDRRFKAADGNADILKFDRHATESGRAVPSPRTGGPSWPGQNRNGWPDHPNG